MERSSAFFIKILQTLAGKYTTGCTFEELTELVRAVSNTLELTEEISSEREIQAKLLEALILLDKEGYIFLDSNTDECLITIKGLIKINNRRFWN